MIAGKNDSTGVIVRRVLRELTDDECCFGGQIAYLLTSIVFSHGVGRL